eukprot:m.223493 g.223493  ORF g.223493 m.223493 type:complete len:840 (-) comp17270_c0_seq2:1876-4395(-)
MFPVPILLLSLTAVSGTTITAPSWRWKLNFSSVSNSLASDVSCAANVTLSLAGQAEVNYIQLQRLIKARDDGLGPDCSALNHTLETNFTATPINCSQVVSGDNAQFLKVNDTLDITASFQPTCTLVWQDLRLATQPFASNAINVSTLEVSGTSFTEVGQGFPSLKAVQTIDIVNNTNLTDVQFPDLEALGQLRILNNTQLTELGGFDKLNAIPDGIDIIGNPNLLSIPAFPVHCSFLSTMFTSITSLNPLANGMDGVDLSYNDVVTEIMLPRWNNSARYLGISYNPQLQHLSVPLTQEVEVVSIEYNKRLVSYSFPMLHTVVELRITDSALTVLDDSFMPSLVNSTAHLRIEHNNRLRRVSAFNALGVIRNEFRIEDNLNLETIDGFQNVQYITSLRVSGPKIADLSGFTNVTGVGDITVFCSGHKSMLFPNLVITPDTRCLIATFYCKLESCECIAHHNSKVQEAAAIQPSQAPSQSDSRSFNYLLVLLPCVAILILLAAGAVVVRQRAARTQHQAAMKDDITRALSRAIYSLQQQHPTSASVPIEPEVYDVKDLSLEGQIGFGNFGFVHKATVSDRGTCALKVLQDTDSDLTQATFMEACLMTYLKHERIVQVHGVAVSFVDGQLHGLVMEYAAGGNLRDYLRRQQDVPSMASLTSALEQVAEAVVYVHAQGVVHRDLAARNCLLRQANLEDVVLADFGLARYLADPEEYYSHSSLDDVPYRWSALEGLTQGKYTSAADTWSFGVLMFEVLTAGQRPYNDMGLSEVVRYLQQGKRLLLPDSTPPHLVQLSTSCWTMPAIERPSMSAVHAALSPQQATPDPNLVLSEMEEASAMESRL